MESFHAGHGQLELDFDPDAFDRRVDEVLETLEKSSFPEPTTELGATRLPIMIVSMPRSGTSLLERILASHPSITGIGEESVISDTSGIIVSSSVGSRPRHALRTPGSSRRFEPTSAASANSRTVSRR